jgi:hypothetical protein
MFEIRTFAVDQGHRVRQIAAALLCVWAWLVAAPATAQPGIDSDRPIATDPSPVEKTPVIELVTMGIGSLIWERHGHIALCVRYSDRSKDACYNYGIGDFQHPVSMGLGFFRGNNSFWAGEMDPRFMLSIYQNADRTIWVQPLPLAPDEVQRVITRLKSDILEANKYYAYDHFWDNCTTRVRDVLDSAIGGKLKAMNEAPGNRTFRDLARDGFFGMRPALLITDIAMGRATDRIPTYYERMFLPDYMREAATKLWGVQPIVRYQRQGPPSQTDGPSGRVLLALAVLLLTCPAWLFRLWANRAKRIGANWIGRERFGIALAILPAVLLGLIFWTLAIISPLPYVRWNESCLIFFPLDIFLFALPMAKARLYAKGRLLSLLVIALFMLIGLLKQPLWPVWLWPLIPALVVGVWRPPAKAS